jgi:HD superfamily phosphohydrolase
MTFESHANTVLAHVEDLPESFEPTWMPGWTTDSYIRGKCPRIKKLYWSRTTSRYSYLYRLINKEIIQARKCDGFWFYSKESIDQLEEMLNIKETLKTDQVAQWYEERKPLNAALQKAWSAKDQARKEAVDTMNEANEAMEQAKEMMNQAFAKQLQLAQTLKVIDSERKKVQRQIKKSEKALETLPNNEELIKKWVNRPDSYKCRWNGIGDHGIPDYALSEDGDIQIHH